MDELRTLVRGAVITADDPGYDEARRVQNGRVDRRPKAIVTVEQTADVVACVNHARDAGLPLAVRGGGHSGPGYGTTLIPSLESLAAELEAPFGEEPNHLPLNAMCVTIERNLRDMNDDLPLPAPALPDSNFVLN